MTQDHDAPYVAVLRAAFAELEAALTAAVERDHAPQPEHLLSIPEAAEALGIGRTRLYADIAAGRIRTCKVGRRRLVPSSAINTYIATLT